MDETAYQKMQAKLSLIDGFLRQTALSAGADANLLSLAARRSFKKKYVDKYGIRLEFNSITEMIMFTPDPEDAFKIRFIARWLKQEQDRQAPWLSRRDEKDRPLKLLNKNLDHAYAAAEKHAARFDKGDIVFEAGSEKYWPLFSDQTPKKFHRNMTRRLPKGVTLKLSLNTEGKLMSLSYKHYSFVFERAFDKDSVSHAAATVVEPRQGKGIAKLVTMHLFRLYKRIGIKNITIFSEETGAYSWARLGFVPYPTAWKDMKDLISKRLDFLEKAGTPEGSLPAYLTQALRTALAGNDPKNFWFIVDQEHRCYGTTLGKLLVLPRKDLPASFVERSTTLEFLIREIRWGGRLDIQDQDCFDRIEAYIKKPHDRKSAPLPIPRRAVLQGAAP